MQKTTRDLGVLVPIVTPCSPQGEPDLAGVQAVCRDMLTHGCGSIFVAGSTGRGPWFSLADRARICAAAAAVVDGDAPLFAGCMAAGPSAMIENAKAMADVGADVAVVTAPGYYAYGPDEVERIFLRVADSCPLPVMIYDIPDFAGMKLDWRMVNRLADHDNVIGFKDSSGDMARFTELVRVLAAQTDFYLLQGKEHLLAESLLAGCSGFVVSLVHIDPRPFVALADAARAGEPARARQLQESIRELFELAVASFARRAPTSTLFGILNAALRERGVCENILLEHEAELPGWIQEHAVRALAICDAAVAAAE